jgi:transposase
MQTLPLTDAEYALLLPLIPVTGRPCRDRRRVLDGIFHVAMSRCTWAEMPERFGKGETARRQLVRWMKAGVLDTWLISATNEDFASLRERICRSWRRVARRAPLGSVLLAKRLGMPAALPCAPCFLPDLTLSETVQKLVLHHMRNPWGAPPGFFGRAGKLLKVAGGDPRRWRVR